MNENYDLESILEEIRRKKQEAAAALAEAEQNESASDDEEKEAPDENVAEPEPDIDDEISAESESDSEDEKSYDEPELSGEGFNFHADDEDSLTDSDSEDTVTEVSDNENDETESEQEENNPDVFEFADDDTNEEESGADRSDKIDFDIDAAIKNMSSANRMNSDGSIGEVKEDNPSENTPVLQKKDSKEKNTKKTKKKAKSAKPVKEAKPEPVLNEYRKPEDAPAILEELHQLKSSFTIRIVLTVLIFAATLYLAAATILPLPMPSAISLWKTPVMYIGANIVLTAAAVLINNSAIAGGLSSLVKLKANNDSLVAFAALAAVLHGAAMTASPEWLNTTAVNIYFPMAVLGIVFNLVGKMMFADRISANFKVVSADYRKYAAHKVEETDAASFMQSTGAGKRDIAYFTESDFLKDFLKTAYDESYVEKSSRIMAPIIVAASVIVGIAGYIVTKDVFAGISAFAALACIASPLTSTLIGNIPMGRAARTLYERGTCIAGYDAITQFSNTDTILLRADDIFPQGTIQMHGMKPFNNELIEDAVTDAASVASAVDCPLKHIFVPVMNKYGNGQLEDVNSYEIYDEEGIVADIRGREVIIGNRNMMNRFAIFLPSKEQEEKLRRDGREVMYVASEGHLSAVFVISYHADSEIKELLASVQERGIKVLVHSNDPFISENRISELFGVNTENVVLMDKDSADKFVELENKDRTSKCLIASTMSRMMLVRAILSADRIRSAISAGTLLQIISVLMGAGIVAFFALTGSVIYLGCVPVLSYQIAWSVVIAIVNSMRKY